MKLSNHLCGEARVFEMSNVIVHEIKLPKLEYIGYGLGWLGFK